MACTLGRVTLPSPGSIRQEGDTLRVGHNGYAFTGDLGLTMAHQLGGYPSVDEPVIPFIYDASLAGGDLDGYYFCKSTKVDWVKLASGLFSWEAELVRIPGWQAPLIELQLSGAVRANDHTITSSTSARSWVGLPPESKLTHGYQHISNATDLITEVADVGERETNLMLHVNVVGSYNILDFGSIVYSIPAADYYAGACKLETTSDGGTTWKVEPGRQVTNLPTGWRLSNDLMRLTHSTASTFTYAGYLSGWESKNFRLMSGSGPTDSLGTPGTITVLRNSPECVAIRIWMNDAAAYRQAHVDFTIRRSAWWLEGVVTNPTSNTNGFGIFRDSNEAGTSSTPGIVATAADASGNKYQYWSPRASTKDTTVGGLYQTGADQTFPFAVGYDTLQDATLETSDAYFVAMRHTQRVVTR